jgi:hypothetical protein
LIVRQQLPRELAASCKDSFSQITTSPSLEIHQENASVEMGQAHVTAEFQKEGRVVGGTPWLPGHRAHRFSVKIVIE